ncbi:lasso peptide biosynthesis B2 protein [Asticcacaulis sp. W401b]|uniref:lasso peptide biosynthesis B2 protein n=1 Tax=Asticcacaulis sp. W401b TaxID=3388666 RepID=UPI003970BCE7
MTYRLTPAYEACLCDGQIILLDLSTDRYWLAPPSQLAALCAVLDPGTRGEVNTSDLQDLLRAKIIEPCRASDLPAPSLPPADGARPAFVTHLSLTGVILALMYQVRAIWLLQVHSLDWIRDHIRTQKHPTRSHSAMALATVLQSFAQSERILPSTDKCLRRSLALRLYLKAHGIDAKLVVAARLRPFGAHAWVQQGPHVLNDHLERVRPFTPLFAA